MIGGTSSMAPSSGRGRRTGERDAEEGPESSCTLTRLPVTAAFKIKDCSCKYQGKCMCVCGGGPINVTGGLLLKK